MKRKVKLFALIIAVAFLLIPCYSQATNGDIIVMLDPGHGKYGTGANQGGTDEATVNWKIANYVKEILDQTPGITGILTRQETTNPSLADRGILAKENAADLLVSFHINSGNGIFNRTMGAETYITGNTKQERFNKNSKVLAKDVLANLRTIGIPSNKLDPILRFSTDGELYSDGMLSDYYGIIRNPMYYGIPAILIEHCYINSPQDREFINSDEKIRKIAQQDANAIIKNKELFRIDKTGNSIATGIQKIEMAVNTNGHPYLYGEIAINDWINGMRANPEKTPKIWLKATDGTKKYEMWVVKLENNCYYFDGLLDNIDTGKKYILEVESLEKEIIPVYHTQRIDLPNKTLGWIGKEEVCLSNNELTIKGKDYQGDIANEITSLKLEENEQGRPYLKGEIVVTEWIDGITWSIPRSTPKLRLKATDGSCSYEFWVNPIQGNEYYFDGYIDEIKKEKEYIFEVESGSIANSSPYRVAQGIYPKEQELGKLKREKLIIDNSMIKIVPTEYYGDIATQITDLSLQQNEQGKSYLKGEIAITEWIGTQWNQPDKIPTIILRAVDGSDSYEFWVNPIQSNEYYFDGYIEGIDTTKEYCFEVELQNSYNISKYKKQIAYCGKEMMLGMYQQEKVTFTKENRLVFGEGSYQGDIATQLIDLSLQQNEQGKRYLKGEIVVTEWIDGITWSVPKQTPKIYLKATDGSSSYEFWVNPIESNQYYFDSYIEGIDTDKTYVLEVCSGSNNNISKYKTQEVSYEKGMVLGNYEGYMLQWKDKYFTFDGISYRGDIANEIKNIIVEGNKLKGEIIVTEWINGITWSVPRKLPKLTLETMDGTEKKIGIVTQVKDTNTYEFSFDIEELNKEVEYIIKVESGRKENTSLYRVQQGQYGKNETLGSYQQWSINIQENKISFYVQQQNSKMGQNKIESSIEQETIETQSQLTDSEVKEKTVSKEVQEEQSTQEDNEIDTELEQEDEES